MGTSRPLRRRTRGPGRQRPVRLVPVWTALAGTFAIAVTVLAVVVWAGFELLGARGFQHQRNLSSATFFDLVKLGFAVVAGIGGVVALVIAYRRQKLAEGAELREATKLHADRFTAAAAQLGSDSSAIQLAGVHAMAGLADDAPTISLRQTCIDVLCSYLRMPYDPDPGDVLVNATAEQAKEHTAARHTYRSLREVRHTVIRVIGAHLRDDADVSWQGHDLDFTGVVFDGGNFAGAVFTADPDHGLHGRVSFYGTEFTGSRVSFLSAKFTGGTVNFRKARFTGGSVNFHGARFTGGTVNFAEARFTGGTVNFEDARFNHGTVTFAEAEFNSGVVAFDQAAFNGGTVTFMAAAFNGGEIIFREAAFIGGMVSFAAAMFNGGEVTFRSAKSIGGTIVFGGATFKSGTVSFEHAMFIRGTVHFEHAKFTGSMAHFRHAEFAGSTVHFEHAEFTGSTLDFEHAKGDRPHGLAKEGSLRPGIVNAPASWLAALPTPPASGTQNSSS